ncbi:MAG TPA: F0F1 ATP synthase subunit A [Bacillota bacterium]|nr:F0F1 ATP synthase subunit A [Bacillota bacterium]
MEAEAAKEVAKNVYWFGLQVDVRVIEMSWLVMAIIIGVAFLASRKIRWIPKGWQNVMEYAIEFVQGIIRGGIGEIGLKYTYFFGSLFLFILVSNELGLVPGFTSPTANVSINLCLAIFWVIWMQIIGIKENGLKAHLKHYFQPFAPYLLIHLLELCVRPLTLTMRLFANIFAGELLLEILTENFKLFVPSVWILMSLLIGAIQAFIFTILTVSYTGLSVSHEDNSHNERAHDVHAHEKAREHSH